VHNGQNPVPQGRLGIRHPVPVTDSATFATPEAGDEDLGDLLLEVLPPDGSTIGNLSARETLSRAAERQISEEEYEEVKDKAQILDLRMENAREEEEKESTDKRVQTGKIRGENRRYTNQGLEAKTKAEDPERQAEIEWEELQSYEQAVA